jgi:hypothetical protein
MGLKYYPIWYCIPKQVIAALAQDHHQKKKPFGLGGFLLYVECFLFSGAFALAELASLQQPER